MKTAAKTGGCLAPLPSLMNVLVMVFILVLQVPGEPEQHGAERGEHQEGGESPGVFHGHPPFRKHHPCGSWRQVGAHWPLECGECLMWFRTAAGGAQPGVAFYQAHESVLCFLHS